MNTPTRYEQLKALEADSAERYVAVRNYLRSHKRIIERVAARVPVHRSVVSKVLHGRAVSAPVEQALEAEETQLAHVA